MHRSWPKVQICTRTYFDASSFRAQRRIYDFNVTNLGAEISHFPARVPINIEVVALDCTTPIRHDAREAIPFPGREPDHGSVPVVRRCRAHRFVQGLALAIDVFPGMVPVSRIFRAGIARACSGPDWTGQGDEEDECSHGRKVTDASCGQASLESACGRTHGGPGGRFQRCRRAPMRRGTA